MDIEDLYAIGGKLVKFKSVEKFNTKEIIYFRDQRNREKFK